MKDAIGYLRVSTKEQGRSGLGLKTCHVCTHCINMLGGAQNLSQ
jgi:hypothetical protein